MSFTDSQVRQLRAQIRPQVVKEREIEGKVLHYLEGWHVIAEANRIFGFDGWDRETIQSQCVWQKQTGAGYAAAYLTRVRIGVRAGEHIVQREGMGSGEATALTPGAAHERASKAAETDATKRALSTFGNSFGLSLYRDKSEAPTAKRARSRSSAAAARRDDTHTLDPSPLADDAPDDAYDMRVPQVPVTQMGQLVETSLPVWIPTSSQDATLNEPTGSVRGNEPSVTTQRERIEKSALRIGEPKRIRNRDHLRFVASQPCLVCTRTPSQAHHLRFAQPRALGRKVSDEFTVPLCAIHHHELHMRGNERLWWEDKNIEPLAIAQNFWEASR